MDALDVINGHVYGACEWSGMGHVGLENLQTKSEPREHAGLRAPALVRVLTLSQRIVRLCTYVLRVIQSALTSEFLGRIRARVSFRNTGQPDRRLVPNRHRGTVDPEDAEFTVTFPATSLSLLEMSASPFSTPIRARKEIDSQNAAFDTRSICSHVRIDWLEGSSPRQRNASTSTRPRGRLTDARARSERRVACVDLERDLSYGGASSARFANCQRRATENYPARRPYAAHVLLSC